MDEMLKAAEENRANGGDTLVRQHSLYHARSMVTSAAEEEEQKKKLIESEKTSMLNNVDELFTLEQMSLT